jgi:hypothetical protein
LPNIVTVGSSLAEFTTIQAAINSITNASQSRPYQVDIAPGVYTESITTKAWVNLVGESVSIVGNLTLVDNVKIVIQDITAAGIVITKTGTGRSILTCNDLTVLAGGIGILNLNVSSVLFCRISRVFVGAGAIGIGDGSSGFGHTHLHVHDLYLTGAGAFGIAALGAKNIIGHIDHILELGAPVNTTGIAVLANGIVRISVNEIICDVVYNVVATGTLHIVASFLSGTRTQAGGADVRENGLPTINPGAGLVYMNNGVPTVGS